MMVRGLVEQDDMALEHVADEVQKLGAVPDRMLQVPLQDARDHKDVFAIGQKIAAIKIQVAAPGPDRRGEHPGDVLAYLFIPGAGGPDFRRRFAGGAPQGGGVRRGRGG